MTVAGGESAGDGVEASIVTAIEAGREVECVIHLRTLHLGPETLLVAAKIAVRHDESAASVVAGLLWDEVGPQLTFAAGTPVDELGALTCLSLPHPDRTSATTARTHGKALNRLSCNLVPFVASSID